MKTEQKHWRCLFYILIVAGIVFAAAPDAGARPKKSPPPESAPTESGVDAVKSGVTEINPTNVAVLDDDFLSASLEAPDPATTTSWTESQIFAPEAHKIATGKGVVVAILDGGFNLNHPDLAGHVSPLAYDAVDDDFDPTDLGNGIDDNFDGLVDAGVGHGTFVAGMVLLAAPDATILPIRVVDDEGFGTGHEFLQGLRYAIDMGADVINCSCEAEGLDRKYANTLARLILKRGITMVVSCGNAGSDSYGYLASSYSTIPVGSVDGNDRVAEFSNLDLVGWTPDTVFAPGVDLFGPIGAPEDDSRGYWSGTSFSAGIVSGAAALARQVHPDLPADELRSIITSAVDPVYDADGNVLEGTGRINLAILVSP